MKRNLAKCLIFFSHFSKENESLENEAKWSRKKIFREKCEIFSFSLETLLALHKVYLKIIFCLAGYNPQRLIEQTKMGVAGYDPEEPDMRGIFMARGPGKL